MRGVDRPEASYIWKVSDRSSRMPQSERQQAARTIAQEPPVFRMTEVGAIPRGGRCSLRRKVEAGSDEACRACTGQGLWRSDGPCRDGVVWGAPGTWMRVWRPACSISDLCSESWQAKHTPSHLCAACLPYSFLPLLLARQHAPSVHTETSCALRAADLPALLRLEIAERYTHIHTHECE